MNFVVSELLRQKQGLSIVTLTREYWLEDKTEKNETNIDFLLGCRILALLKKFYIPRTLTSSSAHRPGVPKLSSKSAPHSSLICIGVLSLLFLTFSGIQLVSSLSKRRFVSFESRRTALSKFWWCWRLSLVLVQPFCLVSQVLTRIQSLFCVANLSMAHLCSALARSFFG